MINDCTLFVETVAACELWQKIVTTLIFTANVCLKIEVTSDDKNGTLLSQRHVGSGDRTSSALEERDGGAVSNENLVKTVPQHSGTYSTESRSNRLSKTIKGVPHKILEAADHSHSHFRTQQGRLPQKTVKVYSDD